MAIVFEYEVVSWNAVAIRENQIIARRFFNGSIEDGAFLKSVIFMPNMMDSYFGCRLDSIDDFSCSIIRSIIRYHDFIRLFDLS